MARPPRRPSETSFAQATPPSAVPDPAPVTGSVTTLAPPQPAAQPTTTTPAPAVIPEPVEAETEALPVQGRRRRKGGKRTFYAEESLIYRMEDLILQWQRKYRRRYGKFPAALIEDAFLAEALSRTAQVELRLKHILDGGDPQAKLEDKGSQG